MSADRIHAMEALIIIIVVLCSIATISTGTIRAERRKARLAETTVDEDDVATIVAVTVVLGTAVGLACYGLVYLAIFVVTGVA